MGLNSTGLCLIGFCYGGLSLEIERKVSHLTQFGYLSTTTGGMAFGLLCIIIASLSSMLGPGLALRGGEGALSMHKAVDSMKQESKTCFTFFILQLLFFHMSSFLLMWVLYERQVAIVINVILGIFLILFIKNGHEIYSALHVKDDEAVTGKFTNFNKFDQIDDLDQSSARSPRGGNKSGGLDNLNLGNDN